MTEPAAEPPPPRYVLRVTPETYREIRQLLISAGQGAMFERWEDPTDTRIREMINLFDIGIVSNGMSRER